VSTISQASPTKIAELNSALNELEMSLTDLGVTTPQLEWDDVLQPNPLLNHSRDLDQIYHNQSSVSVNSHAMSHVGALTTHPDSPRRAVEGGSFSASFLSDTGLVPQHGFVPTSASALETTGLATIMTTSPARSLANTSLASDRITASSGGASSMPENTSLASFQSTTTASRAMSFSDGDSTEVESEMQVTLVY
jgi:hypothetical protein